MWRKTLSFLWLGPTSLFGRSFGEGGNVAADPSASARTTKICKVLYYHPLCGVQRGPRATCAHNHLSKTLNDGRSVSADSAVSAVSDPLLSVVPSFR